MSGKALISAAVFLAAFAANFLLQQHKGCEVGVSLAVSALAAATLLSAKEDFLTGEVSVFLLISPLLFFFPIVASLDFFSGAMTLLVLSAFFLMKKMGGADVILYTETALLFGVESLYILYFSLLLGVIGHYAIKRLKRTKSASVSSIRIIPAIYAALQMYVVVR